MKNVSMKQDGKILTITIDLSKEFGLSKSGKTTIIASSEGNQSVANGDDVVYVGVNVYKK